MASWFSTAARKTAQATGKPAAFLIAFLLVLVWLVTGPVFHFSDTWQLVINTGTTIITFLMVFLIQATQNRDTEAIHLKLDELIRATSKAKNTLVDLEDATDEEMEQIRRTYAELGKRAREIGEKLDERRGVADGDEAAAD